MLRTVFVVVCLTTSVLSLTRNSDSSDSSVMIVNNVRDLIELSNDVADGTSYAGTTILLGADLYFSGSLSKEFNPIGKDYEHYFSGIFNGQGHVISNLAINSSEHFVGLFGVTNATGIRNVVFDASCSVLSSYVYPPRQRTSPV